MEFKKPIGVSPSSLRNFESIPELEKQMRDAALRLDFETAAVLRDRIHELQGK